MTSRSVLVITQAIDRDDRVLGFFHTWLLKLSETVPSLRVICLRKGAHDLPSAIPVHSLGKERLEGRAFLRTRYLWNFLSYIVRHRAAYDSVLVHMNEEYVLLGGIFWRLTGKRIVLWRNHQMGSWKTRLAVMLAHEVCYTSPQAYVAYAKKAIRMPIGIDTEYFAPEGEPRPKSVLFMGRMDPIKRPDAFVDALKLIAEDELFTATLCGDPSEAGSRYFNDVRMRSESLIARGMLEFHEGVPHTRTRDLYRSHAVYVNLTPSGSFDKTIGEAMATGCVVVASNEAVRDVLPAELFTTGTPGDVARALRTAFALSNEERAAAIKRQRAYVEEQHALTLLIARLAHILVP